MSYTQQVNKIRALVREKKDQSANKIEYSSIQQENKKRKLAEEQEYERKVRKTVKNHITVFESDKEQQSEDDHLIASEIDQYGEQASDEQQDDDEQYKSYEQQSEDEHQYVGKRPSKTDSSDHSEESTISIDKLSDDQLRMYFREHWKGSMASFVKKYGGNVNPSAFTKWMNKSNRTSSSSKFVRDFMREMLHDSLQQPENECIDLTDEE